MLDTEKNKVGVSLGTDWSLHLMTDSFPININHTACCLLYLNKSLVMLWKKYSGNSLQMFPSKVSKLFQQWMQWLEKTWMLETRQLQKL